MFLEIKDTLKKNIYVIPSEGRTVLVDLYKNKWEGAT